MKNKDTPSKTNVIEYPSPEKSEGKLKVIGGSKFDPFNDLMVNAVAGTTWLGGMSEERRGEVMQGALCGAIGIKPQDEIEGLLAAQMMSAHSAIIECYRRAMLPEQTIDSRAMNLGAANKLSRTFAQLVETLNRHRGKGQQRVTVEHVHVHAGGQAVVGTVGVGAAQKSEGQSHAIANASGAPMWSENPEGLPLPVSSNEERPMPNARRHKPRRAEGQPQRMATRPLVEGGN